MASMAASIACSMGVPASSLRQCITVGNPRVTQVSSFRCRASSDKNSHRPEFINFESLDNALQKAQVFRDESKGIVCYRTPTGEITCEGIDEGPHFQPTSENQKGWFLTQLLLAQKSSEEPLVNGAGI